MRSLALAIAFILCGVAGVNAAERVPVRDGLHADYGRIVFDWPSEVGYEAGIEAGRLVVTFAEPGDFEGSLMRAGLPGYATAPQVSEDGRRLSLRRLHPCRLLSRHRLLLTPHPIQALSQGRLMISLTELVVSRAFILVITAIHLMKMREPPWHNRRNGYKPILMLMQLSKVMLMNAGRGNIIWPLARAVLIRSKPSL